ncbi:MAG: hypothetical protein LBF70_00425, partial [Holosporales bacterium]|nr:hypothetical protein [Holosporales bacterium]
YPRYSSLSNPSRIHFMLLALRLKTEIIPHIELILIRIYTKTIAYNRMVKMLQNLTKDSVFFTVFRD